MFHIPTSSLQMTRILGRVAFVSVIATPRLGQPLQRRCVHRAAERAGMAEADIIE
jgi:hypothetical protein